MFCQRSELKPTTNASRAANPSFFSPVFRKKRADLDGEPDSAKQQAPAQVAPVTPCPNAVSIGQLAAFNHSNLSATDKERFGTYFGVVSQMVVGPGPDHSNHCMKEYLTTVSNNCPAAVYQRGGETDQPCTGNRCLGIGQFGTAGDGPSRQTLPDGPTSFIDRHRTSSPASLLSGTGQTACSVVCEQIYKCDRTRATTGIFHITRNYQLGSHTKQDGTNMEITTGSVTKTVAPPPTQQIPPAQKKP